jgi:hypothetical protein
VQRVIRECAGRRLFLYTRGGKNKKNKEKRVEHVDKAGNERYVAFDHLSFFLFFFLFSQDMNMETDILLDRSTSGKGHLLINRYWVFLMGFFPQSDFFFPFKQITPEALCRARREPRVCITGTRILLLWL